MSDSAVPPRAQGLPLTVWFVGDGSIWPADALAGVRLVAPHTRVAATSSGEGAMPRIRLRFGTMPRPRHPSGSRRKIALRGTSIR
jgi:hypothetical protein